MKALGGFAILTLLVPVAATRSATPELKTVPVKVEKGIPYATAAGEKLLLDLEAPTEGGPYPAVVLLHGGAWSLGSRTDLSRNGRDKELKPIPSLIETVAARGYVAVTASYRLAPKHKFPAQIEDA